ncbi:MAG TPA: HPr family phosphocarrier protein [Phycisphaerales bacterium]|nr:HPr family phosphocarrier protein [Phycisphaerales bacterium]HRQ75981.1 HPr family phosphocarrier protein [Phycisphaerales bacterium]
MPTPESAFVPNKVSACVKIINRLGLHARPAMMFVETASKFLSNVTVCRTDTKEPVDGKSIMQMMMLAATQGTEIEITAQGEDAQQTINELVALVNSHFMEE